MEFACGSRFLGMTYHVVELLTDTRIVFSRGFLLVFIKLIGNQMLRFESNSKDGLYAEMLKSFV